MRLILGIDPGVTGAIAAIGDGYRTQVFDPPYIESPVSDKMRRFLDVDGMSLLIKRIINDPEHKGAQIRACIEWSQPMPLQGTVSIFTYGEGYGYWLGILACLGIPRTKVRPPVWKREMFSGFDNPDKGTSRLLAAQLFPGIDLGKRKDQGRAESLLLAEYARRRNL